MVESGKRIGKSGLTGSYLGQYLDGIVCKKTKCQQRDELWRNQNFETNCLDSHKNGVWKIKTIGCQVCDEPIHVKCQNIRNNHYENRCAGFSKSLQCKNTSSGNQNRKRRLYERFVVDIFGLEKDDFNDLLSFGSELSEKLEFVKEIIVKYVY